MARKRTGIALSGWIVLDKPLGMSSAQAVAAVRRATGAAKAGHGGTLDPLATGVLPVALGEATKTVSYVMDGTKTYRFRAQWGEARTTDDREGEVVAAVTGIVDEARRRGYRFVPIAYVPVELQPDPPPEPHHGQRNGVPGRRRRLAPPVGGVPSSGDVTTEAPVETGRAAARSSDTDGE